MKTREWPLVLFTLTGQAAAGLAVFFLLPLYHPGERAADPLYHGLRASASAGVFLLAVSAAILSLGHLGRVGRAPRSIVNIGRSWLSREVAALILFIAVAAALAFGEWRGAEAGLRTVLAYLTTAAGGVFVFAMARIYALPTVPEWNTAATPAAFFASSFVLGAILAAAVVRAGHPGLRTNLPRIALIVMGLAYLAILLAAPRFGLLSRKAPAPSNRPDPRLSFLFAVRISLFALAILLWVVSLLGLRGAGAAFWASCLAAFGSEVLGRVLFYSLPSGL